MRRLPVDRIKVDRSFILDLEKDASARDIMRTIAVMCQNLGLQCIVEGVESHAQLQFLATAGCDGYQGYLFARPMPEKAIGGYLRNRNSCGRWHEAHARAVSTLI
ncbi:EAL domain-containing protein (putative c-di-GMP-specific phosphodiesterase class I) [Pseudorhizobium tarimense]|uniref:EAL domain-containing protein (Putative c-di-GMP-specific phosphodiesterase class I) n=1 Tax=Pseudorhizobium tarimense TaxID=1079109 RepID=A0ABV2H7A5_9HYPH